MDSIEQRYNTLKIETKIPLILVIGLLTAAIFLPEAIAENLQKEDDEQTYIPKPDEQPKEIENHSPTNHSFAKYFRPIAYRSNNRIIGYAIIPKEKGQLLFVKLGLMEGDVITKVNDISLVNQKNAIRGLTMLVNVSLIEMEVLRNGAKVSISIPSE